MYYVHSTMLVHATTRPAQVFFSEPKSTGSAYSRASRMVDQALQSHATCKAKNGALLRELLASLFSRPILASRKSGRPLLPKQHLTKPHHLLLWHQDEEENLVL